MEVFAAFDQFQKKQNMEYASINRQYNNGEIKFSSQNQNSSGVLIKCEFKSTFSVVWKTSFQNSNAVKHY